MASHSKQISPVNHAIEQCIDRAGSFRMYVMPAIAEVAFHGAAISETKAVKWVRLDPLRASSIK